MKKLLALLLVSVSSMGATFGAVSCTLPGQSKTENKAVIKTTKLDKDYLDNIKNEIQAELSKGLNDSHLVFSTRQKAIDYVQNYKNWSFMSYDGTNKEGLVKSFKGSIDTQLSAASIRIQSIEFIDGYEWSSNLAKNPFIDLEIYLNINDLIESKLKEVMSNKFDSPELAQAAIVSDVKKVDGVQDALIKKNSLALSDSSNVSGFTLDLDYIDNVKTKKQFEITQESDLLKPYFNSSKIKSIIDNFNPSINTTTLSTYETPEAAKAAVINAVNLPSEGVTNVKFEWISNTSGTSSGEFLIKIEFDKSKFRLRDGDETSFTGSAALKNNIWSSEIQPLLNTLNSFDENKTFYKNAEEANTAVFNLFNNNSSLKNKVELVKNEISNANNTVNVTKSLFSSTDQDSIINSSYKTAEISLSFKYKGDYTGYSKIKFNVYLKQDITAAVNEKLTEINENKTVFDYKEDKNGKEGAVSYLKSKIGKFKFVIGSKLYDIYDTSSSEKVTLNTSGNSNYSEKDKKPSYNYSLNLDINSNLFSIKNKELIETDLNNNSLNFETKIDIDDEIKQIWESQIAQSNVDEFRTYQSETIERIAQILNDNVKGFNGITTKDIIWNKTNFVLSLKYESNNKEINRYKEDYIGESSYSFNGDFVHVPKFDTTNINLITFDYTSDIDSDLVKSKTQTLSITTDSTKDSQIEIIYDDESDKSLVDLSIDANNGLVAKANSNVTGIKNIKAILRADNNIDTDTVVNVEIIGRPQIAFNNTPTNNSISLRLNETKEYEFTINNFDGNINNLVAYTQNASSKYTDGNISDASTEVSITKGQLKNSYKLIVKANKATTSLQYLNIYYVDSKSEPKITALLGTLKRTAIYNGPTITDWKHLDSNIKSGSWGNHDYLSVNSSTKYSFKLLNSVSSDIISSTITDGITGNVDATGNPANNGYIEASVKYDSTTQIYTLTIKAIKKNAGSWLFSGYQKVWITVNNSTLNTSIQKLSSNNEISFQAK